MRYPSPIASATQFAATAVRSLERLASPTHTPLSGIRNFVLLQHPQALGTAIHATPLIPALHAAIPGARIAAVASGFALDILSDNPGFERLVPAPSPLRDLPGAIKAFRSAKLFDNQPYALLQTLGNERSRLSLAALLGGAHTRVGFSVLQGLSAAPLHFDPCLSQIANNLRILDALGHGTALALALAANPGLIEPQVFPSPQHLLQAQALLTAEGIDPSLPIAIFVTQTSPTQLKSWRAERFRAVAETLHRQYNMQIVFVGSASESPAIEALRTGLSFATTSVAGRTGLLELAALMGLADVALTLDTGPMHLLRAMRVPMVILAPAWSPPVEWLPLGNPRARILKNADMPAQTPGYIIDEVDVPEVEQNLHELLALYPPRSFAWRA